MARRHRGRERPSPNLKRRGFQREPKRRFLLYCEGKNTEPAYLDAIKRVCSSTLIAVEIVPGVGVPYTIAERAVERARSEGIARRSRRGSRSSFEDDDQIWAVFDRDVHPRFDEAISLCERYGVRVGRSNPCFELWMILHERDYDRYEDSDNMQGILEKLRPEYDKNSGKRPDCGDLVTRVQQAERRGEVLLQRRRESGNPYGNPSTTVGYLTRELRKADELARR